MYSLTVRLLVGAASRKAPATATSQPLGDISGAKAHIRLDLKVRNRVTLDIPVDRFGADRQNARKFLGGEQSFTGRESLKYIDRVVQSGHPEYGGGGHSF